jgi:hypothetical protein
MLKINDKKIVPWIIAILVTTLVFMILPMISAEDFGTVPINQPYPLIFTCQNSTYLNISKIVSSPQGIIYLDSETITTKSGNNYNYTFTPDKISTYRISYHCDLNNVDFPTSANLYANNDGNVQTTAQGIGTLGFLALMIVLTLIFGYVGFKFFEYDYLWVVGLFFIFLGIILMNYDVWLGIQYYQNISGINDSSNIPTTIFYMFLFIEVAGLLISLALLFIHYKELKTWFRKAWEDEQNEYDEDDWK